MNLTTKGASANVPPNVDEIQVFLSWTQAIDFDLLVIGKKPDGTFDAFYFNKKTGPGIELGDDAGVGDTAGSNNETAKITNEFWNHYDSAMFGIIDYGRVQAGEDGRFDDEAPTVMVIGMSGGQQVIDHLCSPDGGATDGNAYALAKLVRKGSITSFEVVDVETVLKGWSGDQLIPWAAGILN